MRKALYKRKLVKCYHSITSILLVFYSEDSEIYTNSLALLFGEIEGAEALDQVCGETQLFGRNPGDKGPQ